MHYRAIWTLLLSLLVLASPSAGENLVTNPSFETVENIVDLPVPSLPEDFGDWIGDVAGVVNAKDGITPVDGSRMLQFENTTPLGPAVETAC